MKMAKINFHQVRIGFLCFCTTLMLSLSFVSPEISYDAGLVYSITENLRQSLSNNIFVMTIIFSAFYYINIRIEENKKDTIPALYVFDFILACLWLMSEGFRIDDTIVSLYSSAGQITKSIIYVIGATHLLNCIGNILYSLLLSITRSQNSYSTRRMTIIDKFYNSHTYIFWFICMIIVWMPHTIISHPASMECDVWDSLYQYFGKSTFTAHHPPVFTVLVGWFASLGLFLGDINIGFFLWVVLQTIICAAIMAYVLHTMKILMVPRWLITWTFIIAALSPFYNSYVTTIVKDTLFSFATLLYMVELVHMHIDWEKYWNSVGHICIFLLSNIIMILFRHNGKYVIGIMLVCLLIKCILNKIKLSKKHTALCVLLLVLPLLVAKGISTAVISYYGVTVQEGESMRESLSIPFQQTARYAKYYDAETPEEEKEIIDKVIAYYVLENVYEPGISDPVKERFRYNATSEEWLNYFKVWFKQFLKHPLTYFGATMNQNYYLIYPQKENSRLYYSTYVDYFYDHDFMDEMGAAKSMTFVEANDTRISIYKLLHALPISGLFSNIAFYNIILMYMIVFAIHDKRKEFLWITVPVILSDLVVVAGPAIYDNIRYALPVVYAMPLVIAYFLYIYRNKEQEI